MDWQSIVATIMFAAALLFVVWRGRKAMSGAANAGCGSGCGTCGAGQSRQKELLTIDSGPDRRV